MWRGFQWHSEVPEEGGLDELRVSRELWRITWGSVFFRMCAFSFAPPRLKTTMSTLQSGSRDPERDEPRLFFFFFFLPPVRQNALKGRRERATLNPPSGRVGGNHRILQQWTPRTSGAPSGQNVTFEVPTGVADGQSSYCKVSNMFVLFFLLYTLNKKHNDFMGKFYIDTQSHFLSWESASGLDLCVSEGYLNYLFPCPRVGFELTTAEAVAFSCENNEPFFSCTQCRPRIREKCLAFLLITYHCNIFCFSGCSFWNIGHEPLPPAGQGSRGIICILLQQAFQNSISSVQSEAPLQKKKQKSKFPRATSSTQQVGCSSRGRFRRGPARCDTS